MMNTLIAFFKPTLATLPLALLVFHADAQSFVTISGDSVKLDNGLVSRTVKLEDGRLYTSELSLNRPDNLYATPEGSFEFAFLANDQKITGESGWELEKIEKISEDNGGQGAVFSIIYQAEGLVIQLKISYMLYLESPVVRKWIDFTNLGASDIKLEAVDIESFVSPFSKE